MSEIILGNIDAFLMGARMAVDDKRKKHESKREKLDRIALDMDTNFRGVFDSIIPNIHVFHTQIVSNALIMDLLEHPEEYLVRDAEDAASTRKAQFDENKRAKEAKLSPEIIAPGVARYEPGYLPILQIITPEVQKQIESDIRKAVKDFHESCSVKNNGIIDASFNPVKWLADMLGDSIEAINSAQIGILSEEQFAKNQMEDAYHLGFEFKKTINSIFRGHGSIIGLSRTLANNIPASSEIFFGKSFSSMTTALNSIVNITFMKSLKKVLKKYYYQVDTASVGNLVHFGHSGSIHRSNTILNSPGLTKLIYNTFQDNSSGNRDKLVSSAIGKFKAETDHSKYVIRINKDLDSASGILAHIGMTYTQSQYSEINLGMSPGESLVAKGTYTRAGSKTALKDSIKSRGLADAFIDLVLHDPGILIRGTSSPSIMDMIKGKLVSILQGTPNKVVTKTTKVINKSSSQTSLVRIKPSTSHTNISLKMPSQGTTSIQRPAPKMRTLGGQFTSLVSLQNILNQNLHNQIQKNMGTGDRRDILNYRTGRFAESAKVERMSTSREGMITAFYSYMRNPYSTFSAGGQQSHPATRDPKLLISKSIREIGATMVANRMRAVLV